MLLIRKYLPISRLFQGPFPHCHVFLANDNHVHTMMFTPKAFLIPAESCIMNNAEALKHECHEFFT